MKIGSRDEPAPAMMPPTKLWTLLCGLSSSVPPVPQNLQLIHDWSDCSVRSGGWYRTKQAYAECRAKAEREAISTACIIDSQSMKSAEKGGQH